MIEQTDSGAAAYDVRPISAEEHTRFLSGQTTASFLQNPRWSAVKREWEAQSLGLFDPSGPADAAPLGAALVLFRRLPVPAMVPVLGGKRLAYMAEGPVMDAPTADLHRMLPPLIDHLKASGAFLIRMGLPGVLRHWEAKEVRRALAAGENTSISELEPLDSGAAGSPQPETWRRQLKELGFQPPAASTDFEAGQPQFQARIPLTDDQGQSLPIDDVLARMDQSSRRQTKKSTRSELTISVGDESDFPAWQSLYSETAERDGFTGRPLSYFRSMYRELNASPLSQCTLYLAHFEDQLLAAAIYVRQGEFAWYVYGASSAEERKRYAPRALQLRQIEDSLEAGCQWYDLGGLSPSLDPEYPLAGLTRFKTTMGADVVQTLGEWDYPVNPLLARAFTLYMARR
ncbi:lipid II:glycine glycyltransferase FemX [Nesterenkonia lutea]|uniref:Lipid II:glycine glycyltransferase (Peptidoglycan interpeptide bridge formation enzyme) n=1 Tax=Nesterenkonia lutea TaxID=272919 RepID=A0ABR9JAF0_9MICC|nr:peptidoglycan bridge formation glycyltransferase FemA/FemB family protein [Nesterenkonia lutea]MBE1522908.1 lipid II:glycine glycyltransferase (peptidoglycan interpeptide bridge formation enzyme) [Nesterenkonia lutea]